MISSTPKIQFLIWKRGNRLLLRKLPVTEALARFDDERESYVLSSKPIPLHGTSWKGTPSRSVCYQVLEGVSDVIPLSARPGVTSQRSSDEVLFQLENENVLRAIQKESKNLFKKGAGAAQWLILATAILGVVDAAILFTVFVGGAA